VVNIAHF
jgi:hypothetical protein